MSGSTSNSSRGHRWVATILAALLAVLAVPSPLPAADEEECYRCHSLEGLTVSSEDGVNRLAVKPEFFEKSLHSPLNCRECHSDISAIPHVDASMEISCGQACHQLELVGQAYSHEVLYWEYTASAHGEEAKEKITCLVCHPSSSLAEKRRRDLHREIRQCASCHREAPHVRSYFTGFHYLALSRGDRRAPACPDCHTAHRVLPADNEESTTHAKSVGTTCGTGAVASSPAGRCHVDLPPGELTGAGMVPFRMPGKSAGGAGWALSFLYWALLLGLVLRAGLGLIRKG